MSRILVKAFSFVLAAIVTSGIVVAANGMAMQQFARADVAAADQLDVASVQTVTVIGHRVHA